MRRVPLWVLFYWGIVLWIGLFGSQTGFFFATATTGNTNRRQETQPSELMLAQAKGEDSSNSDFEPFDEVVKNTEKLEGYSPSTAIRQANLLEVQPQSCNKTTWHRNDG
jgi:hypothetical protein